MLFKPRELSHRFTVQLVTLLSIDSRASCVKQMYSLSSRSTELKPWGVRKGTWSKEEDELLRKCIEKYGEGKWGSVPKRAGLKRCRKSCRLRWLNYLSPAIRRGKFSDDEVDLIIRLHKLLGNRWSLIAGRIPDRTANDIKNYWNCHLSKRLDAQRAKEEEEEEEEEAIEINNAGTVVKPQPQRVSESWVWPKINPREDLNEGCAQHKASTIVEHEEWLNELINSRHEDELPRAENGSSLGFHLSYEVEEVMDDGGLFLGGVEEWEKLLQDTIYLE